MRTVKMETIISKSFNRTKQILFKPFSLKKWLLLLLIAYLSGSVGGGNMNLNTGGGGDGSKEADAAQEEYVIDRQTAAPLSEETNAQGPSLMNQKEPTLDNIAGTSSVISGDASQSKGFVKPIIVISIALLILVLMALFFALMWIGARFKFIWFDSMVKNDASIKEPFRRYKKEGNSLFKFFLVLLLVNLLIFGLLIGWFAIQGISSGIFQEGADPSLGRIMSAFALQILIFIVAVVLLAILSVFIDHFIVTIMASNRSTFIEAWKKFMPILRDNKKDFLIYFLVLLGIGIITYILIFAIAFAVMLVILLAALILFGLPYLLIAVLFKAKILYIILAAIVAVPFILAMLLIILSVNLPFAVFFRCFSLYFMTSLNCGYNPLPLEDNAPGPDAAAAGV